MLTLGFRAPRLQRPLTTTHIPASTSDDQTLTSLGVRVQLGHYSTDTGQGRVLIGQRIDGMVHLYDGPVGSDAATCLIEQGLETLKSCSSSISSTQPIRIRAGVG